MDQPQSMHEAAKIPYSNKYESLLIQTWSHLCQIVQTVEKGAILMRERKASEESIAQYQQYAFFMYLWSWARRQPGGSLDKVQLRSIKWPMKHDEMVAKFTKWMIPETIPKDLMRTKRKRVEEESVQETKVEEEGELVDMSRKLNNVSRLNKVEEFVDVSNVRKLNQVDEEDEEFVDIINGSKESHKSNEPNVLNQSNESNKFNESNVSTVLNDSTQESLGSS